MKNIIRKILLQEALKPSQFRKYVKAFNRERYSEIFKSLGDKYEHDRNYYRIYIPLGKEEKYGPVSNVEKEVSDFLSQNGYQVLDYIKGIVKFGESKNTTSIGKVLTRLKADELMKKFVSDESRKALTSDASNLMVVISRHPYDIAGSDTDRNWSNCMTMRHSGSERVKKLNFELGNLKTKLKDNDKLIFRYKHLVSEHPKDEWKLRLYLIVRDWDGDPNELGTLPKDLETSRKLTNSIESIESDIHKRKFNGENVSYLINDVKEGSLISYLIKKDDKKIQNPIAVLNIKPYVNETDNNDFILLSDNKMYGNGRPEFKKTIDSILTEINGNKQGFFCLRKGIYNDSNIGDFLNPIKL